MDGIERVSQGSERGSATVLAVDDEELVLGLHARLLQRLGVDVCLAGSVEEARTILRSRRVDVILTDVRMPGEGGIHLFRWLQAERPELCNRVFFVTGGSVTDDLEGVTGQHPRRVIEKPFDLRGYLSQVGAVLASLPARSKA